MDVYIYTHICFYIYVSISTYICVHIYISKIYICLEHTHARRSNQSILKEISLEYSLEGLMLNLKLQYFAYLTQEDNSIEKTH